MSGLDTTRARAIPGWMSPIELLWLAAEAARCTTIVEVGCWQGRSTRALADHVRAGGVVHAIDRWAGPVYTVAGAEHPFRSDVWREFADHLADHLIAGTVRPWVAPSAVALPGLVELIGPVADLVFLDGDHRYASVAADLAAARALVRPGGVLAGHDYGNRTWPGVTAAVDAAAGDRRVGHVESIWWWRC